ncbi:MAG: hypothetical protein QMD23_05095 [Candidatus Bathyarchaeia archaeon]|nr:hypothetical protein [Candidatus Bathyarchaeia archaeon]
MNWKNVFRLISVDVKASRMIRGTRFRRFRENKAVTYALYIGACLLGLLAGWFVGSIFVGITDSAFKQLILDGATSLFITIPTIALLYGLVFTQISQIQRTGAKVSIQPLYWFPITWKEHTLASILANIVGGPFIITIFICSSIITVSLFLGLVPLAVFATFALLLSLFLASTTTEVLKVLQVRISGAVTKAAGRAAVWVRLIGSLLFFLVFYVIYFSLYYNISPLTLIESVAGGQRMLWFIPYVWLGMTLSAFAAGLWLETALFLSASVAFIYFLFLAAVDLNVKFGLYEAPLLKISRGIYAPKTGVLKRLGFSSLEAAILRKDLRAFTRRRELMYIFIFPIIFIIMPLLSAMRGGQALPSAFYSFLFIYLTLLPGSLMAVILGSLMVGSEGESVWLVYSSPVSARSLVKVKYSFIVLFSLFATSVCSIAAIFLTYPSLRATAIGFLEAVSLAISLGMVSLTCGIKGADFRELPPRPRMIRPFWSLINMVVCAVIALAIMAPLIPYGIQRIFQSTFIIPSILPDYYPYVALSISGIIAAVTTYIAYKIALNSADELLRKAEQ